MPNAIKYSASAETLALKKGNFYIGTGDVGKGPTSSTGYYNGITPPSGGYTIYLNKETGGPSIYTVTTEAQIVSLTNSIGSQNFTTSGQCLNWFATQTDKMIFNRDYESIITDGLVLNVDAGFTPSYPKSGTTSYDLSSKGNNGSLINSINYLTTNGGIFEFDGTDDYISFGNDSSLNPIYVTMSIFVKFNSFSTRPHFGKGGGSTGAYYIVVETGSELRFFYTIGNNGGWAFIQGSNLSINTWYNIVITYDGLQPKIYLNGQLNASTNSSGNLKTTDGDNLKIGGYGGNPGLPLNGFSNGLMLYNRALSAAEVLQNYNAQKGRFGL